jgi:hypothetical protein
MRSVLVVYYSQSGEVAQIARAFASQFQSPGTTIAFEALRPIADYPFPWRSIRRFFDVMPECILRQPQQIQPPEFDPLSRFDLVVLAYPVWFLTPAPTMQGFFNSPHVAVLRGTEVITICVSRAMWQQASEWMKQLLAKAGALHCDNIVAVHQGSSVLTLISTPRALLFGKRDALLKVFPRAGVSEADQTRIRELGSTAARRLDERRMVGASLLTGEPALAVKRWSIVPELLAWYCFHAWAVTIQQLGKWHPELRRLGVYAFAVFLVSAIFVGLPVVLLATLLLYPVIKQHLNVHSHRLAAPTGEQRMQQPKR